MLQKLDKDAFGARASYNMLVAALDDMRKGVVGANHANLALAARMLDAHINHGEMERQRLLQDIQPSQVQGMRLDGTMPPPPPKTRQQPKKAAKGKQGAKGSAKAPPKKLASSKDKARDSPQKPASKPAPAAQEGKSKGGSSGSTQSPSAQSPSSPSFGGGDATGGRGDQDGS